MSKILHLGQIASIKTGPFGSQLHQEDYVEIGMPIVTVEHLGQKNFGKNNLPKVSEADYDRLAHYRLATGDVVFSRVGSVDRCSYVSEKEAGWLFSGRCLRIRPNTHVVIPEYLYYYLTTQKSQKFIRSIAVGATMPSINTQIMAEVPILLPDNKTQSAIAKVLGSLDDKIAVNNKMIRIILELQKSIWIKNNVKNLSQIHLINIAEPILGGTPKRSDNSLWNGDILWASVADMTSVSNSHLLTTAEQITEKAAETKRFAPLPAGSVLLSARGTVGHVISLAKPAAFNQSAYGFIAPKGYETALRLAIEDTVEELKSKSYGSVFSTITKQQINECLIPDVFNESFAELREKLNSLETRIVIAEQENQTLARTRDELLPLLMSGKITVQDAEEASAEVGVDKHEVEE